MKTGHIRITDKVYFEYYRLEKPPSSYNSGYHLGYRELKLREYEASKQLIEVDNSYLLSEDCYHSIHLPDVVGRDFVFSDNQPCKAKIKDNKATIIELIK